MMNQINSNRVPISKVVWFQEGPGVRKWQYRDSGVKLLNVANLVNGKLDLSTSDRYISEEEAYGKYKHFLVDEGDLIIASSGIIVDTIDKKMGFANSGHLPLCMNTSTIRFKPLNPNEISMRYFMYFLKSRDFKSQLSKLITGIAQLNYGPSHLKKMTMPILDFADQQRIVAELDCLNEMIALKQEQLKEFDKLAQSIFYDMFGDPISNSKKWETIKLEKITKAEGGGTPSKNNPDYWGGEIAWVTSKDMKQMYISDSQIHITEAGVNNSPAHILPKGTILLVNRSGILKHTLPLALTTKEVTINQDLKALTITDERFLSLFVLYTLKGFAPYLLSRVKAVTVDSIEFSVFKKLEIPLSPLALQQQFAEKIQAIEAQKELVKKSIAETQQLLDSRMDYYFD